MEEEVRSNEKDMRTAKRAAADSSYDNSRPSEKRRKSKKLSKTNPVGIARYCQLLKEAGTQYAKYSSHNTKDCKDVAEMKAKLSGGSKDRSKATYTQKK